MTSDPVELQAMVKKLRAEKRKLSVKVREMQHCRIRNPKSVLRVEMELHKDHSTYNLQTSCNEATPFEEVALAFKHAAKVIGTQLREQKKCPFHPEFEGEKP